MAVPALAVKIISLGLGLGTWVPRGSVSTHALHMRHSAAVTGDTSEYSTTVFKQRSLRFSEDLAETIPYPFVHNKLFKIL